MFNSFIYGNLPEICMWTSDMANVYSLDFIATNGRRSDMHMCSSMHYSAVNNGHIDYGLVKRAQRTSHGAHY